MSLNQEQKQALDSEISGASSLLLTMCSDDNLKELASNIIHLNDMCSRMQSLILQGLSQKEVP
jgi:hypothetical protein